MVTKQALKLGRKKGQAAFAVYYEDDGKTIVLIEDLKGVRSRKVAELTRCDSVAALVRCPPPLVPMNIGGVPCCVLR
jgi:hypothetical protein